MSFNRFQPPGPQGHPLFGSLPHMKADPLQYMAECERVYGAVVQLRLPWPLDRVVLVSDPRQAQRILLDEAESFGKSRVQKSMVELVLGEGLFLAEGATWKRQRRIVQPAFHRSAVAACVDTIAQCAEAMVESWRTQPVRDVHADAANFTLQVAARTLFGAQVADEVELARQALEAVNDALDRHMNSRLPLPLVVPTPTGLRLRRAARQLERITRVFIAKRRASPHSAHDFLSLLLAARDDDGLPLSEQSLRDEVITAFIAGTETTALALAWTLHLLARHPEAAQRARNEVEQVVGDARVEAGHLSELRTTERVIKESLRLFPPFWHIAREARHDCELNGFHVRRGTLILVMTYLMHRNGAYFEQPDEFIPERWKDGFEQTLPAFAYCPFGGGQRKCVGTALATTELLTALATILPRVELEMPATTPGIRPTATLRPAGAISLRTSWRQPLSRVVRAPPMRSGA
jgi:cytochrome P450